VPKNFDTTFQTDELPEDRSLLVVDDDAIFLERISRAMAERGFEVRSCTTAAKALALIHQAPPAFAVVDLRLADGSGLDLMAAIRDARPNSRMIMLTGYGNFPTVVNAIKLGAVDYLTKPADADDLTDALLAPPDAHASPPGHPLSPDRARWLHIQSVFQSCNNNISETARRLNMHHATAHIDEGSTTLSQTLSRRIGPGPQCRTRYAAGCSSATYSEREFLRSNVAFVL
jgi:two-component system, response regulator RegA